MKYTPDYSSRFRILKGGKISLVVSALLVSSSAIVGDANAQNLTSGTNSINADDVTAVTTAITNLTGSNVFIDNMDHNTIIQIGHSISATNPAGDDDSTIEIADFNDASITIDSGVTVSSTTDTGTKKAVALGFFQGVMGGANPLSGTITNNGTLEADSSSRYAIGIKFGGVALNGADITNNGTIDANSTSTVGAFGIESTGAITNSGIENAGTISVSSSNIEASGLKLFTLTDSGILNAEGATIDVTSVGAAFAIKVTSAIGTSTIENAGIINASSVADAATGIALTSVTSSSVTNSGTLNVTSYGIATGIATQGSVSGTTLSNTGTMTIESTNSALASGFNLASMSGIDTTVINDGDINLISNSDDGRGIRIGFGGVATGLQVTNSGTINLDGVMGWISGMDISTVLSDSATREAIITNSGTITANITGGSSTYNIGIDIQANMNAASQVVNTADGLISLTNDTSTDLFGIRVDSDMYASSSITNAGTISITSGEDGFGINVSSMHDSTSVLNSDSIEVDAVNEAVGIKVGGMYLDTTSPYNPLASITNSGTITVNAGTGYVSKGIYVGSTENYSTPSQFNITNSGTITVTVNDEASSDGLALYGTSQTALNVTNTSTGELDGNIHLSNYSTLTNAGTISLPHDANGDADHDAFVGTFVNSGTLTIGLLTDGTTTTHSQLATTDATFEDGSTISVNVLAASTNVALIQGTTLEDVVSASNSLTINGTLNVTDNSELLAFEYVEDGETIDLNIVAASEDNIVASTVAGGGTTNAQSAASALQSIQDAGVPAEMTAYFSALGGLGTAEEVAAAVESTTPVVATAAVGTTTQIMNGVQGIVEMRQNTTMGTGMNSGDIALRDQNLWIKPFGSRGSQDNKDGMNGFEVKAYGFGMGYDAEVAPKQRLGAAFFYTDADVDVNGMAQSSDVKVYTALVYGNMPINTNTDFLFQVGYSLQKTESERVVIPTYDVATADFTAKTASLDLKLMQTYALNKEIVLRPRVEATYRHYSNPSYSESGAGTMNLEVEKFTSTQFITGAGMIGEYRMNKESKLIADIRLGYDWHHDSQTVTASYQGAAGVDFTTDGIDNGGWQYDIGLGYETANILGGDINFMYNYQGQGSSFDNHVLSAKYVWKF
ncbi:MAG: autotransporter domain-containing protein [Sulfuricurvum sp.]|uniref:autotransporter outer membrane beta-barrel domain-containing protein n=1 Tax=Sulfuricurvum sp. TaxID=2025608 RepID=UPI0025F3431C|nr:autotransporter outer membrane beta-barrel domain-containing protein [Sulfuricurvum sp.]MBV5320301.1 autotransporter domain-containing protein [Sulfuricurvum sp.]